MPELTETQSLILNVGAQRPGSLAMPLPKGLHGAAAKKVVDMLVGRELIAEVDANIGKGEPLWRETGDGHGTTLVVTEAGLNAIGIEPVVSRTMANLRRAPREPVKPTPVTQRTGTKQAQLIAMLQAPGGGSIDEVVAVTGWQAHTVRGAISGVLRKKLGFSVLSGKVDGRGRVYRIADTA
jgi:hypothetical protein